MKRVDDPVGRVFFALGSVRRLQIMNFIQGQPGCTANSVMVAEHLDTTVNASRDELIFLTKAGLLDMRRGSRHAPSDFTVTRLAQDLIGRVMRDLRAAERGAQ